MVGKKIRAFREFRGYSQIQLAELSGINVGTIRKYELGIRNPKPDQLEKIATALGLNVSVFLDFNIETVGDVLSLLFSIDDSVNLSLAETPEQKISLTFDNPTMQDFFRKWCQFKNVYEKEKAEILAIEDEDKRQKELDKLNATQEEWKLRAMGTTIGCHRWIPLYCSARSAATPQPALQRSGRFFSGYRNLPPLFSGSAPV